MNEWLVAFLVALGSMRVVETAKEMIPWPPQPWTKSAASVLLATGGCALAGIRGADLVWFGIGTSGLASVLHEVRDSLSTRSDIYKVEVIRSGLRRR